MRAVITVIGKDRVGIIAEISNVLANSNANILDISQTIMQDNIFTMIMLTNLSESRLSFEALSDELENVGKKLGLYVKIQHEDIFNSMHKI
jgi:ACT domain-containing protein